MTSFERCVTLARLPPLHPRDGQTVLQLPANRCTVQVTMWQLTSWISSFAQRVRMVMKVAQSKNMIAVHVIASLGVVHSMWLNPEDLDQIIDSHCGTPVAEKEHFIHNTSLLFSVRLFGVDHYFSILPVSLNCLAGPSETGLNNKPPQKSCRCIVFERDWLIFLSVSSHVFL